jgi:hypothetical protein
LNIPVERGLIAVFLAILTSASATGWAQSRKPAIPVENMTQQADVVGVATVISSGPREEPRTGLIWTDFRLQFSEVWKGDPGREFTLMKAGGQLPSGDKVTVPGHEYTLTPGDSIVVFAIPSKFGNHVPIDFEQGLYRLGAGPEPQVYRMTEHPRAIGKKPTQSLRALKEEVWRALGRTLEPPSPTSPPSPPSSNTKGNPVPANSSESGSIAPPVQPTAQAPAPPPMVSNRWGAGLLVFCLILVIGIVLLLSKRKQGSSR